MIFYALTSVGPRVVFQAQVLTARRDPAGVNVSGKYVAIIA